MSTCRCRIARDNIYQWMREIFFSQVLLHVGLFILGPPESRKSTILICLEKIQQSNSKLDPIQSTQTISVKTLMFGVNLL